MKKVFSYIGTCAGILSIILSFAVFRYELDEGAEFISYGGDAYTGIQNAAALTADNVTRLSLIIQFGTFAILFVLGLFMICYFAPKIGDSKPENMLTAPETYKDQETLPPL